MGKRPWCNEPQRNLAWYIQTVLVLQRLMSAQTNNYLVVLFATNMRDLGSFTWCFKAFLKISKAQDCLCASLTWSNPTVQNADSQQRVLEFKKFHHTLTKCWFWFKALSTCCSITCCLFIHLRKASRQAWFHARSFTHTLIVSLCGKMELLAWSVCKTKACKTCSRMV